MAPGAANPAPTGSVAGCDRAGRRHHAHGPLRPIELATATVMAGLAVALTVVGWFLPHLGLVAAFAVVPLGIVAQRHRIRALVAAASRPSCSAFS